MTDKEQITNNFAKDINVPSKEAVMINGVDVSECIHIDEYKHCNCCNDLIKIVYPNATKCHTENDLRCETYPNCNFKQLARKTQELEVICKAFDIEYAYDDDGKIYGRSNKLRSLEHECEELKKELVTYKKLLNNPESIVALTDVRTGEREVWRKLGSKADRYRKALEEIEQYCNHKFCDKFGEITELINKKSILDIINKAKGEANE